MQLTWMQYHNMTHSTIAKIDRLASKAAKAKSEKTVSKCLVQAFVLASKVNMSNEDIIFLFDFYKAK